MKHNPRTRIISQTIEHFHLRIEHTIEPFEVVKPIGDEVYLSCNAPMESTTALWSKDGGELPSKAVVDHGVLKMNHLEGHEDGVYTCTVNSNTGDVHMNDVNLHVVDFVPVFLGSDTLELPPLKDDEIHEPQFVLAFQPQTDNGMLFYTARIPSDSSEVNGNGRAPVIFHEAFIQNNKIAYLYDVGHGKELLVSTNDVMKDEWNILKITNAPTEATLVLNDGVPASQLHEYTVKVPGANSILYLGGKPEEEQIRQPVPNYRGTISQLIVKGESLGLGSGARREGFPFMDACSAQPCTNGSKCRVANRAKGYSCGCLPGYTGYECQFRSSVCMNENCHEGICLEKENMWQCVCPANTTGLRCEIEIEPPMGAIAFLNETSFLAMKSPSNTENLRISLDMKPNELEEEHLLMYMGSSYNGQQNTAHMSLSIVNNQLLYVYENGLGERQELRSAPLTKNRIYSVLIDRTGGNTVMEVNGDKQVSTMQIPSFKPRTLTFFGGLPPGVNTPKNIPELSFNGCLDKITINSRPITLSDPLVQSTGDLYDCPSMNKINTSTQKPSEPVTDDTRVIISDTTIFEDVTRSRGRTTTTEATTVQPIAVEKQEEMITETPMVTTEEPIEISTAAMTTTTEESYHEYNTVKDSELIQLEPTNPPEQPVTEITKITEAATEKPEEAEVEVTEKIPEIEPTTNEEPISLPTEAVSEPPTPEAERLTEETREPDIKQTLRDEALTEIEPTKILSTEPSEKEDEILSEGTTVVDEQLNETEATTEEPEYISTEDTTTEEECQSSDCDEDVSTIESTTTTTEVPDICFRNDCGINGKCNRFNDTHYECVCNLFYDGPRCNIFKPIEHAASFNGDAFIELSSDEFPHLTSERDEVIEFKFKTEAENGLLLWQGPQPPVSAVGEDYLSVAITNGYLHYSYELGGGAAHMVSPHRINDGKEHKVRIERRGRRGVMRIDELPEIRGLSSGILAMLNADGNIFVGGVPNIRHATGGLHEENYKGCIADLSLNSEKLDLMGTAIDGKNVRPCEEWVTPKRWLKNKRRRG